MQELSDKLRRGLQLAEQRLLEKNATELLERLQEQEKEKRIGSEKK